MFSLFVKNISKESKILLFATCINRITSRNITQLLYTYFEYQQHCTHLVMLIYSVFCIKLYYRTTILLFIQIHDIDNQLQHFKSILLLGPKKLFLLVLMFFLHVFKISNAYTFIIWKDNHIIVVRHNKRRMYFSNIEAIVTHIILFTEHVL